MDAAALMSLWKTDELPACDQGMVLALEFLTSCVEAVESGDSAEFNRSRQVHPQFESCETTPPLTIITTDFLEAARTSAVQQNELPVPNVYPVVEFLTNLPEMSNFLESKLLM